MHNDASVKTPTEHTPTPWKVWREWPDRDPDIPRRFHIHTGDASNPADPEYRRIATTTDMPEHVAEANAHLIVRAVNAHDELLEAARAALHALETPGDFTDEELGWVEEDLRTAIAKAKEEA